jgi:hypothetical protein
LPNQAQIKTLGERCRTISTTFETLPTRHLRVGQPEKIAHVTAPFWSRESRRAAEINAS